MIAEVLLCCIFAELADMVATRSTRWKTYREQLDQYHLYPAPLFLVVFLSV
jgi:hypothetical protein